MITPKKSLSFNVIYKIWMQVPFEVRFNINKNVDRIVREEEANVNYYVQT